METIIIIWSSINYAAGYSRKMYPQIPNCHSKAAIYKMYGITVMPLIFQVLESIPPYTQCQNTHKRKSIMLISWKLSEFFLKKNLIIEHFTDRDACNLNLKSTNGNN